MISPGQLAGVGHSWIGMEYLIPYIEGKGISVIWHMMFIAMTAI